MNRWLKIFIAIAFFLALSGLYFFRDFVFVNANGYMEYLRLIDGNEFAELVPNYTHSKMVAFFDGWEAPEIINFKWYMTFVFTAGFGIISFAALYTLRKNKLAFYIIWFYLVSFILAYLLSLFSYPVARSIIGLLHSPVPLLLMLTASYLEIKTNTEHG
ncbi:MAG: hypothetical protein HOL28_03870 [Crocinitomicaceae bacterium]|nr:hypothetical protein [Crocinitomicaceae bacterium]MBT5402560.1 hypothetical protein [Crocinitomicaceae bacterium]